MGAGRRRELSGCQQALMVNRCGGTLLLLLSLEPCTHTCTNTHIEYCNTQSGGRKSKTTIWSKFLGVVEMVAAGFTQKGRTGRKPYQFLKQSG